MKYLLFLKNKILLFLFIFFIIIIWIIDIYQNLKFGRNLDSVNIKIDCSEEVYDKINVYRISPNNNINVFYKDNFNKIFYYLKPGYFKIIKIEIPTDLKEKLLNIKIIIGKKSYNFSKTILENNWQEENGNSKYILFSREIIKNSNSILQKFNNIINWPGDIKYFIINYIPFFLFWSLLCLFLYILNNKIINYLKSKENKNLSITCNILDNIILWINKNEKNRLQYNNLYWFVFIVIILIALLQRLILISAPYALGDVGGYISPAINFFDSEKLNHLSERSFPYPFFLLILLKLFNDFNYITIIQHLIGLLTGFILILTWKNLISIFNFDKKIKLVLDFLGLLVVPLFLFSESTIMYEHYITRESIYPFFFIIHLFLLIKLFKNIISNNRISYLWSILFFLSNYFIFVYQPRWGFNLILNIFIIIICYFFLKEKHYFKILLLFIIPFILAFILIYFPENILIKGERATESFLLKHLFFGHAKIIDIELEKDIKNPDFNKYNKDILIKIREAFFEDFNKPQSKHEYLGYDFNRLVYSGWINNYLKSKMNDNEYKYFCNYYFLKAVLHNPLKYFKKIILELSQFYNFRGNMFPHMIYQIEKEEYQYSFEKIYNSNDNDYIPYLSYLNSLNYFRQSSLNIKKIKFITINSLLFLFSKLYFIILIIFIIFFIFNLYIYKKHMQLKNELLFALIIFIIYTFNFLISLTVASIYTFDVERYIDDQFIYVLLSQFFAIVYIYLMIKFIKKNN